MTKLTDRDVSLIRRSNLHPKELAEKYSVTKNYIYMIKRHAIRDKLSQKELKEKKQLLLDKLRGCPSGQGVELQPPFSSVRI